MRHCSADQFTLWFVTTERYDIKLRLFSQDEQTSLFEQQLTSPLLTTVQIGETAFVQLIAIDSKALLPENTRINYDILLKSPTENSWHGLGYWLPELMYESQSLPNFVIKSHIEKLLHGSCRKPHYDSADALLQVDNILAKSQTDIHQQPSLLMMSGDQVYADDVAGPMLVAIHQVIELLGLYQESWQSDDVNNTQSLFEHVDCYYQRNNILPHDEVNITLMDKVFGASKTPIFTSVNAKNHLVTLAEVFAMYLLVWSPQLWRLTRLEQPEQLNIPKQHLDIYQQELRLIKDFAAGLDKVQRALAHLPTYMIFDDHDVTDDWNLTRAWEEAAYGHAYSKRIIGNALIGYWLCQGWGNAPEKFTTLIEKSPEYFTGDEYAQHDELIDVLLDWDEWHYHLATSPKLLVLDTRTQRWRSESNAGKPSGLMDWESLSELQQELLGESCVIMVSAAPIYGVKFIETVQRVVTFLGKPLAVDAENWMAHSGTANVMLNIFRHHKTPPNFIILSGDVHYSFFYEVTHRFRRSRSRIIQVTCSGIKNAFPAKLLHSLERLNRYLYATYSPLNWFTKRRQMKIRVRKPNIDTDTSLYNGSGIGLLTLSRDFEQVDAHILTSDGNVVHFDPVDKS